MKLHEFLTTGRGSIPAPTRSVSFKLFGRAEDGAQVIAEARAELAFVNERDRLEAVREADKNSDDERRGEARAFHILHRALRDADDPSQPFAASVIELQNAIVLREFNQVWDAYLNFCAEEFPDWISPEEGEALADEAEKKSLLALLSSKGSRPILSAWRFLVARSGKSQTPT